jgi:hypothetical protein
MQALLALLLLGAAAKSLRAQDPATPPAAPPAAPCDPRLAAIAGPEIAPAFIPSWLVGAWRLTVWVTGAGVPDTLIAGDLFLRPRVLHGDDSVFVKHTPVVGYTPIELEYVPGIEPFRTPAESRSDRFPGVELRIEADVPRLIFGLPTAMPGTLVSLGDAHGATFHIRRAATHEFSGEWSLAGSAPDRPRGGYCAVRIRIE